MLEELFFDLPPLERAARYRELAEEMLVRAKSATSAESRADFVDMATGWLDIADKLEAAYGEAAAPMMPPPNALGERKNS